MIIFTTNINAYDDIPDHFYDGDVKYVMFYDEPIEQKGPWEFIKLDCKYDNPVLNAYHTRCMSHLYFDEPHIWIDGCYTMTEEFVKNSKEFLEKNEITLMNHPTKRSLLGEIIKLYRYGFVPEERLYRFCEDLAKTGFKSSFFNHTINCCIWRHNTSKVNEWNERYWYWYEEYELFHGCQITSAIAEWEVYGKKLPRVPMQVDLKQSTRAKTYGESYSMTTMPHHIHEDGFKKRVARILDLDIEKEAPFNYTDSIDVNDQLIVFTCITNAYDEFPDSYYDDTVKYVCFHDGSIDTTVGPWEYVELNIDIEDPRDQAFYVKTHPHEFFPKNSHTVWINASFKQTKQFIDNSKKSFPFSVLRHGGEFTFLDEVLEGFTCAYFKESDIINLSNDLKKSNYNFKTYSSPQCSILWRKLTDDVIKFNEEWYKWGSRGYNRGNIPFDAAMQLTKIYPEFYDNRNKSGIEMGYINKVGRKGKHPQHGDKKQYLNLDKLLENLHSITGLHSKIYARYKEHSFYMKVNNIIDNASEESFEGDAALWGESYINPKIKEPPCNYTDSINDQLIVFTCITNAYDEFPEDSYYEEDVRYVCFHDGTIDTSIGPWEYIQLDLDIEDPRDFAYYVKAHPHEYFPKDSHTVWIDACFKLTKEFIENSRKSFPFSVLRHGGNFTYIDEVLEGYTCAFFPESSIINLSKDLSKNNYNFKNYSSPQCTILWRKMTDDVIRFNKTWYDWGNRGYNRDNIPFDAAIQLTGVTPKFYDDRNQSGIELGYINKIGRKGKHPQHGDKKQYLRQDKFLSELSSVTGLHSKFYARYMYHSFYMKVYNII